MRQLLETSQREPIQKACKSLQKSVLSIAMADAQLNRTLSWPMCHRKRFEINFSIFVSLFPSSICLNAFWNWKESGLKKTQFLYWIYFGHTWIGYEIVSIRTKAFRILCSPKLLPSKRANGNIDTLQSILEFFWPSVQWCKVFPSEMEMCTQCQLSHNRWQSDHWTKRTPYFAVPIQSILK